MKPESFIVTPETSSEAVNVLGIEHHRAGDERPDAGL